MTSSVLRQWLRELRARLDVPDLDIATLLSLLAAPLVWLQLDDDPSNLVIADASAPGAPLSPTPATQALLVEAGFPEHTRFLLRTVCANWIPALTKEQRHAYFDAYFVPTLHRRDTHQSAKACLLGSRVHANSLRVLANALNEDRTTQDRFVMQTILPLLVATLQHIDMSMLYQSQQARGSISDNGRETAVWREITSILCSVPTQVANALAGGRPPALLESTYPLPPSIFSRRYFLIHNFALEITFNTWQKRYLVPWQPSRSRVSQRETATNLTANSSHR